MSLDGEAEILFFRGKKPWFQAHPASAKASVERDASARESLGRLNSLLLTQRVSFRSSQRSSRPRIFIRNRWEKVGGQSVNCLWTLRILPPPTETRRGPT